MNHPVQARTLVRAIKILFGSVVVGCAASTRVAAPWVVVTKGERATVSIDTSRIRAAERGYRVHLQTRFTEPAYRPTPGGPAYDLGEATLDVDCGAKQAHSLEATVLDSKRQPVYRETPSQGWREFREHDLGEDILTDVCRVLAGVLLDRRA